MPLIPLDQLHPHPDNANCMTPRLLDKLIAHLRASGDYPPLIVRPHPSLPNDYEILDGHHRAQALRRLDHTEARCEVWNADDEHAQLLLLTLNRLHGEDDPVRRGALLRKLSTTADLADLAALLPDDAAQIRKLIALTDAPAAPARPPDVDDIPQAVTFFLTAPQRRRLFARLRDIARDRSEALVSLLDLDRVDSSVAG